MQKLNKPANFLLYFIITGIKKFLITHHSLLII